MSDEGQQEKKKSLTDYAKQAGIAVRNKTWGEAQQNWGRVGQGDYSHNPEKFLATNVLGPMMAAAVGVTLIGAAYTVGAALYGPYAFAKWLFKGEPDPKNTNQSENQQSNKLDVAMQNIGSAPNAPAEPGIRIANGYELTRYAWDAAHKDPNRDNEGILQKYKGKTFEQAVEESHKDAAKSEEPTYSQNKWVEQGVENNKANNEQAVVDNNYRPGTG